MPPRSSNINRKRIGLFRLSRAPNWLMYVFLNEYLKSINGTTKILLMNINSCIFKRHYAELLNPNNASIVLIITPKT